MIMTDEFKPIIRDPHKSANMLEQPVASVPVPQPPSDPIEQVLSPREVSEGLAKADPLTRHPRVSSIMLSVVFGLLLLAAAVGVWWLGVRTMEGQSYEDMVWSKFDAALPGWLEPVVHVFTISTVVIATSAIMSIIALAVLIVRKRWLLIAQLAVFGGICFAAAELLKPLLPRPYLINLESNPNNSAPSGHVILARRGRNDPTMRRASRMPCARCRDRLAVCGTRRIVGDCGTVAPADRRDHGVADRRRSGNDHACRDVCERHG